MARKPKKQAKASRRPNVGHVSAVSLPAAENWSVDRLVAYERNARTHSELQVAQIAASIAEFGWTNPVLIGRDGKIIAGHGRVLAAKQLGLSEVPVLVLDHLSSAQRRAYVIADNKLALNAGWDDELLATELRDLGELGYDLDLTGFESSEVDKLLATLAEDEESEAAEEETPAPQAIVVSRPGDLWLLGSHRLLCGDSTEAKDVKHLLGEAVPHLMVTDPPYGVEYDPAFRNQIINRGKESERVGEVLNDDRADWREAWALFPGEVAYIWHAATKAFAVEESLRACEFETRAVVIWAKSNFAIGRGHYHWQHEPAFYVVRKGGTGHWQGMRDQSTVWSIEAGGEENEATVHGTQKPVECMRRPMLNNSRRGDCVYEPFGGSGSTIIAAESIGRRCFAMELSEAYCDVIVRRWQKFTGKTAVLATSGEAFSAVESVRSR